MKNPERTPCGSASEFRQRKTVTATRRITASTMSHFENQTHEKVMNRKITRFSTTC
jgi:hypothetical protein